MANGAVRKAKEGEVEQLEKHCNEQGRILELVSSKAVCTRKAPDSKRKFRGVVCGNYMQERSASELSASGVGDGPRPHPSQCSARSSIGNDRRANSLPSGAGTQAGWNCDRPS